MAGRVQPDAKRVAHGVYLATTRSEARKVRHSLLTLHEPRYPKVCECLCMDEDTLFAFCDLSAAHRVHLRVSSIIGSAVAAVRHRLRQAKRCGCRVATLTMVYKLATAASTTIRFSPLSSPVTPWSTANCRLLHELGQHHWGMRSPMPSPAQRRTAIRT